MNVQSNDCPGAISISRTPGLLRTVWAPTCPWRHIWIGKTKSTWNGSNVGSVLQAPNWKPQRLLINEFAAIREWIVKVRRSQIFNKRVTVKPIYETDTPSVIFWTSLNPIGAEIQEVQSESKSCIASVRGSLFHMIANQSSSSRLDGKAMPDSLGGQAVLACYPSHKHCKSVVVKVITRSWLATWAYVLATEEVQLSWDF